MPVIPEEMLRAAAAESCSRYVESLTAGYDPEERHEFSPGFERSMDKLRRRADRAPRRAALQRVAAVLLALLLTGAAWLAVSEEARAAVFGWVRSLTDSYFVYHHEGGGETAAGPGEYRPTWLPEGYEEMNVKVSPLRMVVYYANAKENRIRFTYIINMDDPYMFVSTENMEIRETAVNGQPAELYIAQAPEDSSGIVWTTEDTMFSISGFLTENELIRMAESVQKK